MATYLEQGFWMVLPYDVIQDHNSLMLSPAAVKEERDRQPHLLADHSWPWDWTSVNDTTLPHTPSKAMQFRPALAHTLYAVHHANPKYSPVRLAKHDVSDRYYCMFLNAKDCLALLLVLPKYNDKAQLLAVPMAMTMGWVQSPPTFCIMSETVCDRANAAFD